MRKKEEIEERLLQAVQEYEHVKEWNKKAWERYREDKKYWGKDQADYGEVDHSGQELAKITREVTVLKWCLKHEMSKATIA